MGQAIGDVLPMAIGVAISPVPIIAVILMLLSQNARQNAPAFLAGWVVALAVVATVVLLLANGAEVSSDEGSSDTAAVIRIVLGVALLYFAFRQWQQRPGPDDEPEMPGWMKSVDSMTPAKSAGLGALIAGVNPKNLALTLGAALAIAQTGLSWGGGVAVPVVVFVVIGA